MSSALQEFTCPDCGRVRMLPAFNGQRQRCPQCALERRRRRQAEYNKRFREKQPLSAPPKPAETAPDVSAGLVGPYCRGCVYLSGASGIRHCEYILVTGISRPCPAGEGCTVRRTHKGAAKGSREDVKRMLRDGSFTDVDIALKAGVSVSAVRGMRESYEKAPEAET